METQTIDDAAHGRSLPSHESRAANLEKSRSLEFTPQRRKTDTLNLYNINIVVFDLEPARGLTLPPRLWNNMIVMKEPAEDEETHYCESMAGIFVTTPHCEFYFERNARTKANSTRNEHVSP